MLNYSDKAVSKWERGEAIPDLRVLIQLASIYNIKVDDIITQHGAEKVVKPKTNIGKKRILITLLSVGLVWFVATLFFMLFFFIPTTEAYAYLTFIIAPFAMSIVLTVFSVKWGNRITNTISTSLILWTLVLILHIFVITFTDFRKIFFIYIVAAVFEVLILLWFALRKVLKKKK
jgi:transcriptional regulator with XRE-family HTH domain